MAGLVRLGTAPAAAGRPSAEDPAIPPHTALIVRALHATLGAASLACVAGSCRPQRTGGEVADTATARANTAAPTVTDPGAPIQVRPGQRFTITLESNPTTGYRWTVTDSSWHAVLQLVDSRYQAKPIPSGMVMVGVGGHELWTFRALAPGAANVTLLYRQPWTGGSLGDTTRFHVLVR